MQSEKNAARLLAPFLASLLFLVLVMAAYAQVPGNERKTEGGTEGPVLAALPPIPARFTVLYTSLEPRIPRLAALIQPRPRSSLYQYRYSRCPGSGPISDFDNDPTIEGTVTIPSGGTRTFSSQNTALYSEDFTMTTTDNINQGVGRILANSTSSRVICTAQVLDPVGNPPSYVVKLTLFDSPGEIVGSIRHLFLPLILKQ